MEFKAIDYKQIKPWLARVFPAYTGRRVQLTELNDGEFVMRGCYWSEGSRSTYYLVDLNTGKAKAAAGINPISEREPRFNAEDLKPQVIVAEFKEGSYPYLLLHVKKEDWKYFISENPDELKPDDYERIVLVFTRGLKPSYGGVSNYRFVSAKEQTGITLAEWNAAKERCINNGWLNKAGAITAAGKNLVGMTPTYTMGKVN